MAVMPFLEVWYRGIRTRTSAVGHGIEAGSGNDVIKPEIEKKSRDTVMDRFEQIFIAFMASEHCLGIPVVLLLVEWY